jgi:hypothetical protein
MESAKKHAKRDQYEHGKRTGIHGEMLKKNTKPGEIDGEWNERHEDRGKAVSAILPFADGPDGKQTDHGANHHGRGNDKY